MVKTIVVTTKVQKSYFVSRQAPMEEQIGEKMKNTYLEKIVSDVYTFDYCRNSAIVVNYCEAQKDFARKEV